MAFIPGANIVAVRIELDVAGVGCSMNPYLEGVAPADDAALLAINGEVADWCTTQLMPTLSTDAEFTGVTSYAMDSSTAPKAVASIIPPVVGGAGADINSRGASIVISLLTGGRGRSQQGRIYLPGAADSAMVNGVWAASVLTTQQTVWQAFGTQLATIGWTHVVVSRQLDGVLRTALSSRAVTAYRVNAGVGTQRRRNAYTDA